MASLASVHLEGNRLLQGTYWTRDGRRDGLKEGKNDQEIFYNFLSMLSYSLLLLAQITTYPSLPPSLPSLLQSLLTLQA